jgi:hypothetical protein
MLVALLKFQAPLEPRMLVLIGFDDGIADLSLF